MPLATVHSYALLGVNAQPIQIEVHLANGLPGLTIVGLPEASVRESKERVRSAISNSGFEYPSKRITVNLAPADIPKFGSGYDLAIAVGILRASEQLADSRLDSFSFLGELSLSGQLRPIPGILPVALQAQDDHLQLITAESTGEDFSLVDSSNMLCASSLCQVAEHLLGGTPLSKPKDDNHSPVKSSHNELCMSDVQGQNQAKRALTIAAAGGHSLLMQGPPGTGKTMLASRIPGIMPQLDARNAVEVASIYSISSLPNPNPRLPPFRAPHHTCSRVALVGGGSKPAPGEISLAHKGVLFLDELPEFPSRVLEVLRQPLESGEVSVSRAAFKACFPARFQLVAAMNPCPCGYLGEARCRCTPDRIAQYQGRISGPLLDRIDMHIRLQRVRQEVKLNQKAKSDSSAEIRKRVTQCKQVQLERQGHNNSELSGSQIQEILNRNSILAELAQRAIDRMDLSMRAIHRIVRISQTIADLEQSPLKKEHMLEALNFRQDMENSGITASGRNKIGPALTDG